MITTGIFVRLFCRDFVHKWREGETSGDENFTRTFKRSPGEPRNAGPATSKTRVPLSGRLSLTNNA